MAIDDLAELLHETSVHHDTYEKSHEAHNWWDWYGAYMNARLDGAAPEVAVTAADHYMDEVLHVRAG